MTRYYKQEYQHISPNNFTIKNRVRYYKYVPGEFLYLHERGKWMAIANKLDAPGLCIKDWKELTKEELFLEML